MKAHNPVQLLVTLSFIALALACSTSAPQITPGSSPTTTPEGTSAVIVATPTRISFPTAAGAPAESPSLAPTSEPTPEPITTPLPGPVVSIGNAQFTVDVADTGQERTRGLSGRPSLAPGTGMLFVFDEPGIHSFWMIEMRFPLDFVWIGADCTVVDLTEDVPPPQPGQSPGDMPRYRPAAPVRYVLEINAGEIESAGIAAGDAVTFEGDLAGNYGC